MKAEGERRKEKQDPGICPERSGRATNLDGE